MDDLDYIDFDNRPSRHDTKLGKHWRLWIFLDADNWQLECRLQFGCQ